MARREEKWVECFKMVDDVKVKMPCYLPIHC